MFAGQFVPVKIVTSGKEWGTWKQKYPPIGSGIPYLYVIRADGTSLYAKSGAPKGDDLPKMLFATLEQSGLILSPGESEMIQMAVAKAEKFLETEQPLMAAKEISRLKKIGRLGELGSFAKPSMRADEIVKQLSDSVLEKIQKASERISSSSIRFEDVLEIVSIKNVCSDFPALKKQIKTASRELQKNATAKPQIKPAELLLRARQNAASTKRSDLKRAERSYVSIIEKFTDSPAAEIARAELHKLNPDAPALSAKLEDTESDKQNKQNGQNPDQSGKSAAGNELRTWNSEDGKFSVVAKLIEYTADSVKLERENGKQFDVPLDKLSKQDRDYIRKK